MVLVTVAAGCPPPVEPQTGAAAPSTTVTMAPAMAPAPAPSEQQCRMLAAKPVPAQPGPPTTDPAVQYRDFFEAHRDAFRCCFDAIYAPAKPLTDAKIALEVSVDRTGKLRESPKIVKEETTASTPQLDTCMIDVAKLVAFPAPVSEKALGYKRVFDFKAHR